MTGSTVIGVLPDGRRVYASDALVAQVGFDRARYFLVDREWLRLGYEPPGYYRVRTRPFSNDYVLVRAESQSAAIEKYLATRSKP